MRLYPTYTLALFVLLSSRPAAAFVADGTDVSQTLQLRPPSRLGLASRRGLMPTVGDGSSTFLGKMTLPPDPVASAVADDPDQSLARRIALFVQNSVGARVELMVESIDHDVASGDARVHFVQGVHGLPIVGTSALASMSAGALHYAHSFLVPTPRLSTTPAINADAAHDAALKDARSFAASAERATEAVLQVLFVGETPVLVYRVDVATQDPWGSWSIYVNAQDGSAVTRHKLSLDLIEGAVTARVETECEGGPSSLMPLPYVEWAPGEHANSDGDFRSQDAYKAANVSLFGPYVRVDSFLRNNTAFKAPLKEGQAFNEIFLDKADPSQVDPYYHASYARAWARTRMLNVKAPGIRGGVEFTDSQLTVNVNLPSGYNQFNCNAYYDLNDETLNFYVAYKGKSYSCANTSRLPKVIYHEYGHALHHHLSSVFDPQLSEGIGDYISAKISGDPDMTGLFGCTKTIRSCDNSDTYCDDDTCDANPDSPVHDAAQVVCGTLWDLRRKLQARDKVNGADTADNLFFKFITLAGDVNSAYDAMIAADTDADNNPRNGTDHSCEINAAFDRHFPGLKSRMVLCPRR